METSTKFVNFAGYCPKCKHWLENEVDDPCNQCLEEPVNAYSHKPVFFEDGLSQKKHASKQES